MQGVFFTVSLGCPKNLNDLEVISGSLLDAGFSLSYDPEYADIYIINTCAFIPAARNEAEGEILKAIEWKEKGQGRKIIVSGCLGAYDKKGEYRRRFPQVDIWTGIDDIWRMPEIISGAAPSETKKYLCDENTPRLQLTVPHIAYLKIADGCNNCCTYCAIPSLRGRLRSRPAASVLAEASRLVANGVKELIIVAQDVTAYGMDRPGSGETLASLLKEMEKIDGEFCIRLLYTHPAHFNDELIDTIAVSGKVLPYIDMPLQHISDHILKAMNRHVGKEDVENLVTKLRKRIPHLVLRSTFITGFPGESEADFEELAAFCRKAKFDRLGIFPFSPEPGTVAAGMADAVPTEIAESRASLLMTRQIARMKRLQAKRVGNVERILIDEVFDKMAWGRSYFDAPEIDNWVIIPDAPKKMKAGAFYDLKITGVHGCDVIAGKITSKRK